MAPLDVSILFSTRNRVDILARTLETFRALDTRDLTWELVAVDNGSSDSTAGVLARARESLPLVTLSEPVPGKNRALNRALAIARGRLLIFTDDDVLPSHGWVAEYVAAARRWPGHSIFAGTIRPAMPPGTPPALADERFRFASVAFARYNPTSVEGVVTELPFGPNHAIRSRLLDGMRLCESIGPCGRNYPMGSETELLLRLRARGEGVVFVPSAPVVHVIEPHQVSLRWLWGRGFRFGRGQVRLDPDVSSRQLLGAPRYLFREAAVAGVQAAYGTVINSRRKWERVIAMGIACGAIREYRALGAQPASVTMRTT